VDFGRRQPLAFEKHRRTRWPSPWGASSVWWSAEFSLQCRSPDVRRGFDEAVRRRYVISRKTMGTRSHHVCSYCEMPIESWSK